jgi:Domain of Unknown Function with PDB structure (DUF3857)/Transglutaminase-like superfamily
MKYFSIRTLSRAFSAVFFLALSSQWAFAGDETSTFWRPVSPAEIEMKTPVVEPDADAEAIFWDITLDDKKSDKLIYRHYVRVKIFTERGREKFAKMDIPYVKGIKIDSVAARVIKPDGAITYLQPGDVFDREIVRVNKTRVQARSFAVSGIDVGVIVEYQYSETRKNDSASGERLILQRDIPMQSMSYHIRPASYQSLNVRSYNLPSEGQSLIFSDDPQNKGFQVATMTNIPALKEEPNMPPEDEVRRWAYLSYSNSGWMIWSFGFSEFAKQFTRNSKPVDQQAALLSGGMTSQEEKLRNIYEFVQTRIRNITFDRSLTDEQREKMDFKNASEVLEKGMGNAMHIDMLFYALARSAGFQTSVFLTGDRTDNFFSPEKYPFAGFIHPAGIAVAIDNKWRYFNPGTPYLGFGQLAWHEEGMMAMLVGSNGGYEWKSIPLSDQTKSPARRTGKFSLLENGALEGTVRIEYEGHQANRRRREGFLSSAAKREEDLLEEAKENAKNAEVTAPAIENFEDPSKPLVYSYKVSVPNYAQKTGKRMFLQPGFFEYGTTPAFSSSTRTYPIYFSYPWSESDSIEIQLPKGFTVDTAENPAEVADPSRIGSLSIMMNIDPATGLLKYKRSFYFGANGKILFPTDVYQAMRGLFGRFHKADTNMITLKQV